MRVLYLCPFANHAGHPPTAAATETKALAEQGIDVTLQTFDGLMHGVKSFVPERQFISRQGWLVYLRKVQFTQWPLRIVEMISLYSKVGGFDVIHLRDGDPFVWLAPMMTGKGQRWFVSVMGSSLFTTDGKGFIRSAFNTLANGKMWKPFVEYGLKRSKFIFVAQTNLVQDAYKKWLGGAIANNLTTIERGAPPVESPMDKIEARVKLGIPLDKTVALVFGAPHGGKDTECVFRAAKSNQDVVLLHAGSSRYSIGVKPSELATRFNLNGQAKIIDQYIPESDKPMYFGAADFSILSYTRSFKATSSMLWESCRFGLPVIASDANHLKDDVFENAVGLTFESENPYSLAESMRTWNKLSVVSKSAISQNCTKYADANSMTVWAKKAIKEYERLMA